MAFEIKIEISAEPALLSVLNTLAAGIATKGTVGAVQQSVPQKETPKIEVPKTTIPKSELPQKEVPQSEEQKKDPNATVDSEFLPAIRSTVASFCELKGKDDGKAAVKKWLKDRNIGGLSKMTFGQADEFCAWLESEIEVLKNAG